MLGISPVTTEMFTPRDALFRRHRVKICKFPPRSVENVRRVIKRYVKPHARSCKIRWRRAAHGQLSSPTRCSVLHKPGIDSYTDHVPIAQICAFVLPRNLHELIIGPKRGFEIIMKLSSAQTGFRNYREIVIGRTRGSEIIMTLSSAANGVPTSS